MTDKKTPPTKTQLAITYCVFNSSVKSPKNSTELTSAKRPSDTQRIYEERDMHMEFVDFQGVRCLRMTSVKWPDCKPVYTLADNVRYFHAEEVEVK